MPLKVGVIGAGIGGLSAAIGLRRAGAEVEIYERSKFKNEVGGAITVTPNGSRVLESWGFDDVKAGAVEAKTLRMVDAHTLEPAFTDDLTDVRGDFGAKMAFYHRVDLHNSLKDLAQGQQEGPNNELAGPPAVIRLGQAVVDIDCETGVIILADGTKVTKDLLVIADGIKSRFISKITGEADKIKDLGWSAYRCLVPMDAILSDPETRPYFEGQAPGYWTPFYLPEAFYMVAYACRDNRLLNIAIRHETRAQDRDKDEDWNAAATHADVLEILNGYHPVMRAVVLKAPDVKVYKLVRREPLPRYWRGRAVIVGDAAHTILPTHAQGAVLAIEEAAALELLFTGRDGGSGSGSSSGVDVSARLELFEDVLKRRIHAVQFLSDSIPGTRDEARQRAEEICGDDLFDHEAMNFTEPVRKFFYSYDIRKEVTRRMREAGYLQA
ncbi:hypothetical protein PFICI_08145 [Pestalotiopsis fici W106-1]|uniref:FAD-binding domain-containing protein n=1 Tax=Pestalotiopsis fici (strain W106-1 / CGMCC3.15140) TaxID=1229662 RepID=W3X618_PESFW|nr:uncharacterized protein PFICI_08145 [Pestalotiopsis fici W106-1]ETS80616.1 hypothetical protein PFICI_08145 [Pestalotiopsis fici W106-1]